MKMLPALSSVPELSDLDPQERIKVVLQWRREANKPWSGYLLYVGFFVFIMLLITFLPLVLFPGLREHEWVLPFLLGAGILPAQLLYDRLILRRRRDLLQRALEMRRRAPQT